MATEISIIQKQIENLLIERGNQTKELTRLNSELSKAKALKRGSLKKAIRNVEQAIKKIDNQCDDLNKKVVQLEKTENQKILAHQGIDSRANLINSIGSVVGEAGKLASGLMGAGGLSAIGVSKQDSKAKIAESSAKVEISENETKAKESNTMLYIIGGIILVVVFLFSKKS
jgi:VIT1/CCC1 family predicted Fe2+/Mn2+ transporter